jgi:hypothetical protein
MIHSVWPSGPSQIQLFTEVGTWQYGTPHWESETLTAVMIIFINHCFINNYLFCYSVVVHFNQYFKIRIVPSWTTRVNVLYMCYSIFVFRQFSQFLIIHNTKVRYKNMKQFTTLHLPGRMIQKSLDEWSQWNNSTVFVSMVVWCSPWKAKFQNQKTAEIQLDKISEWLMFIG